MILEENYERALSELFRRIASHKKRDGELVQVNFEFYVSEKWRSILNQLSTLLIDMQKQINYLGFSETDLSWDHLTELFDVYERFEDPDTFPFIFIDLTEAESQTSRKLVKDMRGKG